MMGIEEIGTRGSEPPRETVHPRVTSDKRADKRKKLEHTEDRANYHMALGRRNRVSYQGTYRGANNTSPVSFSLLSYP